MEDGHVFDVAPRMDARFTPTSDVGAGRGSTGPPEHGDGATPKAGKLRLRRASAVGTRTGWAW